MKIDFPIFEVLAEGGMSMPEVGEGRFIPKVIIDKEKNFETAELIKLHKTSLPGDIQSFWLLEDSLFFKPKFVILNLNFLRPMELKIGIKLNFSKDFAVIDGIIQSRAFYLEVGEKGDKVSELKNESILIEVPFLEFDKKWEQILLEVLKEKNKNKGFSKKEIDSIAKEQIIKTRKFWNIRRPTE